jgi:HSP20 family protein
LSSTRGSIASLLELRERMNRLFDELVHPLEPTVAAAAWAPTADVVETPEGFELSLDLAGVDAAAISVEVSGGVVVVRGTRGEPAAGGDAIHRLERRYGPFLRTFELPAAVEPVPAARRMDEGVLRLTMQRVRV